MVIDGRKYRRRKDQIVRGIGKRTVLVHYERNDYTNSIRDARVLVGKWKIKVVLSGREWIPVGKEWREYEASKR